MNNRTTASVRTDHIYLLSNFVGRLQAGVVFAPTGHELTELGNLAGALNAAIVPPIPPPDPADPLARMRLAPSQLSMWALADSPEISAMYDLHDRIAVAHQLAFYGPGGVGNVSVFRTGAATYNFVRFFDEAGNKYPNDEGRTVPDVNGAGDAYVALMCRLSGLPVIRPLSP